ncbi:MAG TPA: hypothetical protein VLB67_11370 [Acidimicrobiia bacterium]|nr:hypothetical protein [Acidimicrobiia bacterium]
MTILRERQGTEEITRMPARTFVTEWVTGLMGVLAAGVGAWMYYVPTDWFLGGMAEGWFFGLFIAAGLLLTAAFGFYAQKTMQDDGSWTFRVTMATVLALAAFAGAVIFALILIF